MLKTLLNKWKNRANESSSSENQNRSNETTSNDNNLKGENSS